MQDTNDQIIAGLQGITDGLLHTVVANAPILLFSLDKDGIFTLAEGKGLEVLGLKETDILGESVFNLNGHLPRLVNDIRRALSGDTFTSEIKGRQFIFESWYAPVRDSTSEVTGCIGVCTDITNQKRSEETLQKQTSELTTLLEVSRLISSTLEIEKVLSLIAENLTKVLGVSGCTLSRWDRKADAVVVWIEWRVDSSEFAQKPGDAYKLDDYPATRAVLEGGQPMVVQVSDPDADPAELAFLQEMETSSLLMLPLTASDRIIGLIELDNEEERLFTQDEIRFCQGLADQAANAIDRARLYQEVQKRLDQQTALREVGAVLSSTLEIKALLHLIVEQMGKAINATSAYLSSFNEETKTSKVMAEYYSPEASPLERVSDLDDEYNHSDDFLRTLEVVRGGKPDTYHVDDPDLIETTRRHLEQYGGKSVLEIPLRMRGQFTAIAELWESGYRRDFTPDDIAICEAIAQQAAVALEHARLYEQAQKEIRLRRQMEKQLRHDAFHDALTRLPNRALFMDRLERAILRNKRNPGYRFAVLFLDLDRFKVINDSLGHQIGDSMLVEVSRRLEESMRDVDTVARLGGDEFVVLVEDIKSSQDAERFANRIQERLIVPLNLNGHEVISTASIGIVVNGTSYTQPDEYLRDADTAMYHAKAMGKARYEVFSSTLRKHAITRLTMEADLRRAVEKQEFRIHYQPITSLKTGKVNGMEALVRWQHPTLGLILPARFIDIAEETGLIVQIGEWVLKEACQQVREWQMNYPSDPPWSLSVNISSKQLSYTGFVKQVGEIMQETGLERGSLSLEITESVIVENTASVAFVLNQLKDLGVSVQMDDFGTGYSSLSYLRNFPMDVIKIDRSFIDKMDIEANKPGLVRSIISMAQELGMRVIGEGIETEGQLTMLTGLGCDYGQGFHISVPLDGQAIGELLSDFHQED
jgi:diguanylate cyclase (GGDEF)-like protein/PAS domain S-box-containing protein